MRVPVLLTLIALAGGCDNFSSLWRNWNHDGGGTSDGGITCGTGVGCELCENPCAPYNYVFVTSRAYTPGAKYVAGGNRFSSVDDADAICNELAHSASTTSDVRSQTRYVAWISDSMHHAVDRVRSGNASVRGWIRPDHRPFADSLVALTSGQIFYPARFDESGNDLGQSETSATPRIPVATGSDDKGLASDNAQNWTSGSALFDAGDALSTTYYWATSYHWPGGNSPPVHLYCFGVDNAEQLQIHPAAGRTAFLSSGTFLSGGGVAAADLQCQTEAANLPGKYRALLSTSSLAAFDGLRFDPAGPTWIRRDGIPWLETPAGLSAGNFATALNLDSQNKYWANVYVWTGTAGQSCADWMSTVDTERAVVGEGNYSGAKAWSSTTDGCAASSVHLYCLQYQ